MTLSAARGHLPLIFIPQGLYSTQAIHIRYMKKVFLVLTIFATATAASASVSLDSCRNMAVRNNKTIRMAEENLRGAGYYKEAARAAYLPGIDFTGTYIYNQHEIKLLGEDAKLPTMSFDPATQSFNYNILKGRLTGLR